MKRILYAFFALMIMISPVQANDDVEETNVIDLSVCKYLIDHRPAADVEYTPGVDVKGNPVVEADINDSAIEPPKIIRFPLEVDALETAGLDVPDEIEGPIEIGEVSVENNQLMFNGKPLRPKDQESIIALCEEENQNEPANSEKPTKTAE